jgi:hypothetical protein
VLETERRTYKTLVKGRLVRDGGGIEPDVATADVVGADTLSEIEVQLSDQDTYENFASFWQRQHPVDFAAVAKESKQVGIVLQQPPNSKPAPPYAVDSQVFDAFTTFVLDPAASGFQPRTRFDKVSPHVLCLVSPVSDARFAMYILLYCRSRVSCLTSSILHPPTLDVAP